jgi:hypothetical protein
VGGERQRRLGERARAEMAQAGRVERAPVDRDGEARGQRRRRAGGTLGVQVTGAERRAPSPDRQQGEVEAALAERRHAVEEVGVPGEVEAPRALDQEADRLRRDATTADLVDCLGGGDEQRADPVGVARSELDQPAESPALEEGARPGGDDQRHSGADATQRAQVDVVAVEVGDQDRVEALGDFGGGNPAVAAQRSQPAPQGRVGQQPDPVELDQDRGVADVDDPVSVAGHEH